MERDRNKACNHMPPLLKLSSEHPASLQAYVKVVSHTTTLQINCKMRVVLWRVFSDFYHFAPQGRHSRRPGEEESDVDIEGFEEEDDGKPKTPAPVRQTDLLKGYVVDMRAPVLHTQVYCWMAWFS